MTSSTSSSVPSFSPPRLRPPTPPHPRAHQPGARNHGHDTPNQPKTTRPVSSLLGRTLARSRARNNTPKQDQQAERTARDPVVDRRFDAAEVVSLDHDEEPEQEGYDGQEERHLAEEGPWGVGLLAGAGLGGFVSGVGQGSRGRVECFKGEVVEELSFSLRSGWTWRRWCRAQRRRLGVQGLGLRRSRVVCAPSRVQPRSPERSGHLARTRVVLRRCSSCSEAALRRFFGEEIRASRC